MAYWRRAYICTCTHASMLLPRLFLFTACVRMYKYLDYHIHSWNISVHVCSVDIFGRTHHVYPSPAPQFSFDSHLCLHCLVSAAAFFRCLLTGTEWPGHTALLCQQSLRRACSVRGWRCIYVATHVSCVERPVFCWQWTVFAQFVQSDTEVCSSERVVSNFSTVN